MKVRGRMGLSLGWQQFGAGHGLRGMDRRNPTRGIRLLQPDHQFVRYRRRDWRGRHSVHIAHQSIVDPQREDSLASKAPAVTTADYSSSIKLSAACNFWPSDRGQTCIKYHQAEVLLTSLITMRLIPHRVFGWEGLGLVKP